MEELKKEVEKMKDQIKALRRSCLILSVTIFIVSVCLWIRYFQIRHSVSEILRYLQDEYLIHRLTFVMYQVSQML